MRCLDSSAQHHESGERLARALLDHRCHYRVPYGGQGQKVRLHIAKLASIAADLDLRIHAAVKKKQAITQSPLVTSSISGSTAMLEEGGCRKIGTSKVARANIWSRNDNFARLVCWQGFASSIHNENVGPGHRASYWQRRIPFQN